MTGTLTMEAARPADRDGAVSDSLRLFTRVRSGTIRLVDGVTEEQAGYMPGPDAWSVAQILDHLLLTEALYRIVSGTCADRVRRSDAVVVGESAPAGCRDGSLRSRSRFRGALGQFEDGQVHQGHDVGGVETFGGTPVGGVAKHPPGFVGLPGPGIGRSGRGSQVAVVRG